MKTERARELYSDYAEGILSPALTQALEQHFENDTTARADFDQFQQMYTLLGTSRADEVDVPLGFRAKVLELAAEEHARREAAPGRQAALSLTGWFGALGSLHRRRASVATGAAFAIFAFAAIFVHQMTTTSTSGFGLTLVGNSIPTTIKSVTLQSAPGSGMTHLFHIHLPVNVKRATVMAYVLTSNDQIADPATAMPALSQPQVLTNDEELQIPVTLLRQAPAGTTLNLLVQWTPDGSGQTPAKQVVFTPVNPGVAPSEDGEAPISGNYFNALEALAAEYNITVIADAGVTPNTAIVPPAESDDASKALRKVTNQTGYQVHQIDAHTFQVYSR